MLQLLASALDAQLDDAADDVRRAHDGGVHDGLLDDAARPRLSLSWSKLAGEETTTHSSSSSSSSSFADAFFDALPTEPEAVAEEESLYLTLYGTVGAVATTSTPGSSSEGAFAEHVRVKQSEKTAPEPPARARRSSRSRVTLESFKVSFLDRDAQVLELIRGAGKHTLEHHRLRGFETGQRRDDDQSFGIGHLPVALAFVVLRRLVFFGRTAFLNDFVRPARHEQRVPDPRALHVPVAGDEELDVAASELLRAQRLGVMNPQLQNLGTPSRWRSKPPCRRRAACRPPPARCSPRPVRVVVAV